MCASDVYPRAALSKTIIPVRRQPNQGSGQLKFDNHDKRAHNKWIIIFLTPYALITQHLVPLINTYIHIANFGKLLSKAILNKQSRVETLEYGHKNDPKHFGKHIFKVDTFENFSSKNFPLYSMPIIPNGSGDGHGLSNEVFCEED